MKIDRTSIGVFILILLLVLLNNYLAKQGFLSGYRYHELPFILRRAINFSILIEIIVTPFSLISDQLFSVSKPGITPNLWYVGNVIGIFPSMLFYNQIAIRYRKWRNRV
jgi:hypothetical protein